MNTMRVIYKFSNKIQLKTGISKQRLILLKSRAVRVQSLDNQIGRQVVDFRIELVPTLFESLFPQLFRPLCYAAWPWFVPCPGCA